MLKVISSKLQILSARSGKPSPIVRAAPTGVASNQIQGQTMHSLFQLPIDRGKFRPLADNPGNLQTLQSTFRGIHYLVLDEKSMLGLYHLGWIDQRLREIFPSRSNQYWGGISVILMGDFFQLPPVGAKSLISQDFQNFKPDEYPGYNAYRTLSKSILLTTIQRQQGEGQAKFRTALSELRFMNVSMHSWEVLTSRCAVNLNLQEVQSFANAVRLYPQNKQVSGYNNKHLLRIEKAVIVLEAVHEGTGAKDAEDTIAGNLTPVLKLCVGYRVMLTRNLWSEKGLVNGAQGTVFDMSWANGVTDPRATLPEVIMVVFDHYTGPPFTMPDGSVLQKGGKLVVPILPVEHDFQVQGGDCSREQFPLVVSYAITVHKSQGITLARAVCDLSTPDFTLGLSYVAVSRVKSLEGMMFDAPFDRARVFKENPVAGMRLRVEDLERRSGEVLEEVEDYSDDEEDESL